MTEGAALIMAASALEILSDRITELGVDVRHDTSVERIDTVAKTVTTVSTVCCTARIPLKHMLLASIAPAL